MVYNCFVAATGKLGEWYSIKFVFLNKEAVISKIFNITRKKITANLGVNV